MEVQIETPGGLRRQMKVRIPAEQVSEAVQLRLNRMGARAKIPGFRPGKVPKKVLQHQYGPSARMDAVSELVQSTYPQALGQVGLNPAGMPKIDITLEQPGEPLEYVADFEVYPEIKLSGLDELAIEMAVVTVTDEDVDRLLKNLQTARRSLAPVDRAAASGDVVNIDFEGKLDGEVFQGGQAEGSEFEVGSNQFLPDLEQGIIGHAAGEHFVVDVSFPEDYRAEPLRGKTAQFHVTLNSVQEVSLPPVSDAEFLAAHGAESVEELREKSQLALQNESAKAIRARVKAQVMEQLLEKNPLELPQALVDQEIPRLRQEAAGRMHLQNISDEQREQMLPASLFDAAARRRVALGLLVGEVIQAKGIKLDPERVDRTLDEMANDFEQPDELKAYYRGRPDLMRNLSAAVLEDQVVDALVAGVTPVEKPLSLEELLGRKA